MINAITGNVGSGTSLPSVSIRPRCYIFRGDMDQTSQRDGRTLDSHSKRSINTLRILIAGATGILAFCLAGLLDPRFLALPPTNPKAPVIVNLSIHVSQFLNSPYIIVPLFLVWTYLAISRRDQPRSWIFAFLAGVAVSMIVVHWTFRWI
jgi:hypothetical protein